MTDRNFRSLFFDRMRARPNPICVRVRRSLFFSSRNSRLTSKFKIAQAFKCPRIKKKIKKKNAKNVSDCAHTFLANEWNRKIILFGRVEWLMFDDIIFFFFFSCLVRIAFCHTKYIYKHFNVWFIFPRDWRQWHLLYFFHFLFFWYFCLRYDNGKNYTVSVHCSQCNRINNKCLGCQYACSNFNLQCGDEHVCAYSVIHVLSYHFEVA